MRNSKSLGPVGSRRSRRRSAPYWTKRGDADSATRRAVRDHIESPAEVARYREINLRALGAARQLWRLHRAISYCSAVHPCREFLCPHCTSDYRLWLAPELMTLAQLGPSAFVATILLQSVPGPELSDVDVRACNQMVRKRLIRAGFRAAIGGTEAAYKAGEDRWIVHMHLLVFGEREEARPRLQYAFRGVGLHRPVVTAVIKDPVDQITYLQKFATYHRPGSSEFGEKGRAYPLKPRQIVQLARWTENRCFEDFLFVLGFRRRGPRFVAEPGFRELLRRYERRLATWRRGDAPKRVTAAENDVATPRKTSVTHSKPSFNRRHGVSSPTSTIREDKRLSSARQPGRRPSARVASPPARE
jgi:hypothetical protein